MASALMASMTGFSRADGVTDTVSWTWELRSVNGRGLELRFRLPGGFDTLEPALKTQAALALKRGNVTLNLTVRREEQPKLAPDPMALEQVLALATSLAARIPGAPPVRAEALLALPGVLRAAAAEAAETTPAHLDAVRAGFAQALDALAASRREEGGRLADIATRLLDEIAALHAQAIAEAADQPQAQRARMMENLQALLASAPTSPEERIAQEVALLAARSDVREELDRLHSHIAAACALLAEGAQVGRRLDFLVQEFNREANTLCSKSASIALTATGLRLKATIEQLREQVQNVE